MHFETNYKAVQSCERVGRGWMVLDLNKAPDWLGRRKPSLSQLWSFQIRRTTFLSSITFVDPGNLERTRRVVC